MNLLVKHLQRDLDVAFNTRVLRLLREEGLRRGDDQAVKDRLTHLSPHRRPKRKRSCLFIQISTNSTPLYTSLPVVMLGVDGRTLPISMAI